MPSIGLQLENVWGAILYSLLVICLSNYGMDSAIGNKRLPSSLLSHLLSVHTVQTLTLQDLAPTPLSKLNGKFSDSRRVASARQGQCLREKEREESSRRKARRIEGVREEEEQEQRRLFAENSRGQV